MIWLDYFLQAFVHALAWVLAIALVVVSGTAVLVALVRHWAGSRKVRR